MSGRVIDRRAWHERYDVPGSAHARRLVVVQRLIAQALDAMAPGPVRVISMCAGDGRDILGVLRAHPRARDVTGILVELDPVLAGRARNAAPGGLEVVCGDAGITDAYDGAAPADFVLSCGIFGNVNEADIRATIDAWPSLCARRAVVIWTRAGGEPDIRDAVRRWVSEAGFDELAFEGAPEPYGVGLARMRREPRPHVPGTRMFTFAGA